MRGVLPDVNLLLAFAWDSHAEHGEIRNWFANLEHFATCPITELGFLRVSMSPAYCASFEDAIEVLKALRSLSTVSNLADDFDAIRIPEVSRYRDTTDAYLVSLAKAHGLRFATLDKGVLRADWAASTAFHPLQ